MGESLTRAGYEKLVKDLAALLERKERLSRDSAEALEAKDPASYQATKEAREAVDARIGRLRASLGAATFVEDRPLPKDTVAFGCRVTIRDEHGGESSYALVSEQEAEPAEGRISASSPLARALVGKKVGESVRVELPGGARTFIIERAGPIP